MTDHRVAKEGTVMNLVPHWYGPIADHDALDDLHTAGRVISASITSRHHILVRQVALDSIVEMRAEADGTPAGVALLAGIIDGIDEMDRLRQELDRPAA